MINTTQNHPVTISYPQNVIRERGFYTREKDTHFVIQIQSIIDLDLSIQSNNQDVKIYTILNTDMLVMITESRLNGKKP